MEEKRKTLIHFEKKEREVGADSIAVGNTAIGGISKKKSGGKSLYRGRKFPKSRNGIERYQVRDW